MNQENFVPPEFYWGGWSNPGEDDKALELLKKSGMPYKLGGSITEVQTPLLKWGIYEYRGLYEIACFIERWKNNTLPQYRDFDSF